MTREEEAKQRKMVDAMRPKRPPTMGEIVKARERGYWFQNDLLTEQALKWVLPKHPHSLSAFYEKCRWCALEKRIMTLGHMASFRPSPTWWRKFLAEVAAEHEAIMAISGSFGWVPVRVAGPDGKWWIFNAIGLDEAVRKKAKVGLAVRIGFPFKRRLRGRLGRRKGARE